MKYLVLSLSLIFTHTACTKMSSTPLPKSNETLALVFNMYSEGGRGRTFLFKDTQIQGEKCSLTEANKKAVCTVEQIKLMTVTKTNLNETEGFVTSMASGIIPNESTVPEGQVVTLTGDVELISNNNGTSWEIQKLKLKKM